MSADGRQRNHVDFKLIRAISGKRQRSDEIDVESAIDASSSRASLSELSRRGYSSVNVVDRRKVEAIIRQAVGEVIEHRTSSFIEAERQKIEEESLRRVEELLKEQKLLAPEGQQTSPAGPTGREGAAPPAQPPFDPAVLAEMIRSILRLELRETKVKADAPQGQPPPAPLDVSGLSDIIARIVRAEVGAIKPVTGADIASRMGQLVEVLQRAEQTASKLSSWGGLPRRYHRRSADIMFDKQRNSMLEEIFNHNVQLQLLNSGVEVKSDAAQPAQAVPQPGGDTQ